jgi:hypothetical protein
MEDFMKTRCFYGLLTLLAVIGFLFTPSGGQAARDLSETKCRLNFNLKSWSIFYKSGKGHGKITCDNGQSVSVRLRSHGGGVTFGKNEIIDGHGSFTHVRDIGELFGGYAASEAHAGVHASAGAQALWNGHIGLTLSGTGKGWDLGFSFGKLKIEPDLAAATKNPLEEESSFSTKPIIEEEAKAADPSEKEAEKTQLERDIDLYFPPE